MGMEIRQLHPLFVGEVSGIDITQPLTPDQAAAIEAGMDRYAVLVFHDQRFTDEQQVAFSRNFGEIERAVGSNVTADADRRLPPELADVSNLDKDHKPLARDDRRRMFNLGNQLWHSDSSFRAVPAKFSLLSGRNVTDDGGNTEFADMRAAYDDLDVRTKAEIEDLVCEHSLIYSRGTLGFADFSPEERRNFTPVRQRLVRTHPVTGRKSLFLASHIGTIVGWPMPEARAFIRDLTEHATQPKYVHVHRWRQYDLVMWDNRQTMHRVRRYDATKVRDMRRTTIAGLGPTVEQAQAA
jgi:alpha-ketoglutarate-dependent 2,4-dichlorophenoxyacetate dioxygenase